MDKQYILDEIRRSAELNGGRALGVAAFKTETGIKPADWKGVYWIRWSDALTEAGFAPNKFTAAIGGEVLAGRYAELAKSLGHLPVEAELRMKRRDDHSFPSDGVFRRLGNKNDLIGLVAQYCRAKPNFSDVYGWCEAYLNFHSSRTPRTVDRSDNSTPLGTVYLAKSGRYYKSVKLTARAAVSTR